LFDWESDILTKMMMNPFPGKNKQTNSEHVFFINFSGNLFYRNPKDRKLSLILKIGLRGRH
jgi:hypothetical protein